MHVVVRTLTIQDVESILARRRASRLQVLESARRSGITPMVEWFDSGRAGKVHAHADRRLLEDLSVAPEARLDDLLGFWISTGEGDKRAPDYCPEHSMLPWLLPAKAHLDAGRFGDAFLEICAMNKALGGLVPDSLDPHGDGWADVSVKAIPSA